MNQNECERIRPDGARCQAPLQAGKSFCFFHDPEQQENRAAARRSGGFMRDHLSRPPRQAAGQAVEAYRTTSRTDDPALLPVDMRHLPAQTRDDITQRLEAIFNWLEHYAPDPVKAKALQVYTLNTLSHNLGANERKEREAARSAERAAIRAERAAERAVQQALQKAGFNSQSRFSGTDENSPPFQRREGEIRDEQFHSAEGTRTPRPFPPEDGFGSSLSQKGGGERAKRRARSHRRLQTLGPEPVRRQKAPH